MKRANAISRCVSELYDAGFALIALRGRSKKPREKDWPNKPFKSRRAALQYFREHPDENVGVLTGDRHGLFVLDVDGMEGLASLRRLTKKYGKLPRTVLVSTGNEGRHIYFKSWGVKISNSAGKIAPGIDVRGDGGYVVGVGSTHPNGTTYRYSDGRAIAEIEIAKPPKFLRKILASPRKAKAASPVLPLTEKQRWRAKRYILSAVDRELERLRKAPVSQRNATLNRCSFRLGQLYAYGEYSADEVLASLGQTAAEIGLQKSEIEGTVRSGFEAGKKLPRKLPPGMADETGPIDSVPVTERSRIAKELCTLGETDVDNAKRFARRYSAFVQYVPETGWHCWDGSRWARASQNQVYARAIVTAEAIADEALFLRRDSGKTNRRKFAEKSKSKGALDTMLGVAASMLNCPLASFDRSSNLITVANGTIDLKSGRLTPHDPRDLITNAVAITYDPDAKASEFLKYLKWATRDNKEVAAYLQRAVGYSLTGDVSERVFFFLYGPHNSGKTTFLRTIARLVGAQACIVPVETLLVKHYGGNIPNDIARLRGVRFAAGSEANFNSQLDEAKIKNMTGGDRLIGRFLYKEHVEFDPTHKLWIAANDYPRVRETDGAMWGRIRTISFSAKLGDGQLDKDLQVKLDAELPGILAWAVKGARAWYKAGLGTAAEVASAGRQWREKSDIARMFYQECCLPDVGSSVDAKAMIARFNKWCSDNGETPLTVKELKGRLVGLNLTPARTNKLRYWKGVKLIK